MCVVACGPSGPPYKVNLDDFAVPDFKYGRPPGWMEWRKEFGTSYSSELARKVSYARIRALRSGNFRQDGKGIRIGVFDADQNRLFNDAGVDRISVSYFASDTMPLFNSVASPIQAAPPFTIGIDDQYYRIDSIAADGTHVLLTPVEEADSLAAYLPTRIPACTLTTIDGDTVALADFLEKDKYLYVECWSTWFQASVSGLPELKAAYTRFQDDVNVLQLVMNEIDYDRVRGHMERYDLPWTQAIYTDEIGKTLMQNSIPYGILFAPDGSILKMGFGPGELEPFLAGIL